MPIYIVVKTLKKSTFYILKGNTVNRIENKTNILYMGPLSWQSGASYLKHSTKGGCEIYILRVQINFFSLPFAIIFRGTDFSLSAKRKKSRPRKIIKEGNKKKFECEPLKYWRLCSSVLNKAYIAYGG